MQGITTKIIHSRYPKGDTHGTLRFPVYDSASFEFNTADDISKAFQGKKPGHSYSRITNPTVEFFEKQIRDLSGASSVLALASGMAAISNVILGLCSAGDNVITSKYIFGNTYSLFEKTLKPWGLETIYADFTKPESLKRLISKNTRAVFLETVTNPQLEVADIRSIAEITKESGIALVVDSTITPLVFTDLKSFGVDIEIVSSTKYISGGATSVGGLIIDYGSYNWSKNPRYKEEYRKYGPFAFLRKLRKEIYRDLGACLSPHNAYLQSLGLETFKLRVDKSCSNALKISNYLDKRSEVRNVNYPGLDSCKTEIVKNQFGDLTGALLTFDLESKNDCFRFIDKLRIIRRATNLNDNKTLVIHPASTIFCEYNENELIDMGIRETMIRLSVGIEDLEDLISDLDYALKELNSVE